MNGLKFLLILLLFYVLPVFIAWGFCSAFGKITAIGARSLYSLMGIMLGFGGLKLLVFFPLAIVCFLSPVCSIAALYCYQTSQDFKALSRLDLIAGMVYATWQKWLVPSLAFTGLLIIGLPAIGFVFFLGFLAITAYFNLLFTILEKEGKAAFA